MFTDQSIARKSAALVLGSSAIALTLFSASANAIEPKLPNNCGKSESMFLALETKSYAVNICGSDKATDMVVFKKSDRVIERVPLEKTDRAYYEAALKDKKYILARTPKGNTFTVTKVTYTELVREPVMRGW
jgi:hypothetical protein